MKKISKVFYITIVLIIIAVGYGVINPVHFEEITSAGKAFVASTFGWYYMLIMTALLLLSIFMIFSPYGKIRLGKDTDRPQFSTITWIAMLFSAGMGIGLVFYGAAEPLSHYAVPATEDPQTPAAFKESMRKTFLHYGLHIWALYGMVALALAYFQFRKGEPGLISATLKPIFGEKVKGPLGTVIDVLAVFATAFGVATSLGLGAVQINAGLDYLFGFTIGIQSQIIIVTVVTVLFIGSAWSGLSRGIRYLSNINLILAVALLGLILILGPTLLILNMFTDSVGGYFTNLIDMSMGTAPLNGENRGWLDGWTIFYWAWWISWSPFVSMFIARVSKGRTIREFMAGVLLVPSFFGFLWFSAFGTTAIEMQNNGVADLASLNIEVVAFEMFNSMPFSLVLSLFAILLVTSFFITSADSATYVLGMQSTYGSLTPPNSVKVIWGIIVSTIALILLSAGGLLALQNTIIIAALPFSFVILLMMYALFKSMNEELYKMK
ncbi:MULTISPECIES: BCCT family transporter [unclassified Sporosarcina]|uniref:BCCT family transporter n=1 Tax=unclassified Sporosarcina TaxID=2647733 RepID=UPI000C165170|nr:MULTISPECIES: BCCT family transporter [unclassified Sporosarcina]PIC99395.1 glycine/betaine ABC transporter permease [Sporosarcina sp. P29]PID06288.1 glycine/betaine ABC transporter permease [Sporosarcina sp. P30]PID09482.1 glycine/betaine ABC transporter permease [Sporosarcina sp. P31]PID12780.1 glycine/betaine ABC transporter permease [Sporosarcina sp. P32b]